MSQEILQTGLQLAKSAVEADGAKNYTLASALYEQAILNLKLAIVSETNPGKTALVSSKIEEYTSRNKFIKSLASSTPQPPVTSNNNNNQNYNFPSIPSTVSPSIANVQLQQQQQQQTNLNNFPSFPSTHSNNNSFNQSQPQPNNFNNNNNNGMNNNINRLSSMPVVSEQFNNRSNMGRVEAYEVATGLAGKGRKEEESRDYKKATGYYEQACTYFLTAMKSEPDPIIKKSIQDEAKIYLERIEKLKPYVVHQQQQQQQQMSSSIGSLNSSGSGSSIPVFPNLPSPSLARSSSPTNSMSSLSSFPSIPPSSSSSHQQYQPQQQQQYHQQSMNHSSMSSMNSMSFPTSAQSMIMQPTSSVPMPGAADRCAACNAVLSTNSIRALERSWHPECFSVSIICAGCQKPFSLVNLSLKVKDNKAYHPLCFESTTGLYQEERRTFVGSSKYLFFSIQLQRKFYRAGETIQFGFIIDNPSSKKVDKVVAYVLMTETRMEITGTAYERKSRKTTAKLGRCEFHHSNRFPLVKDRFEGDFFFSLPPNLLPSEVAGVDANFVREYQLVVKCVGPPLKIMTLKLRFNLTILESIKQ